MSNFLQLVCWLNKSKNMNEFYHMSISIVHFVVICGR